MRYIVLWRKPAPDNLDWDFYVCEDTEGVERVIDQIKKQGVHQYRTYELGEKFPDLSSEY